MTTWVVVQFWIFVISVAYVQTPENVAATFLVTIFNRFSYFVLFVGIESVPVSCSTRESSDIDQIVDHIHDICS